MSSLTVRMNINIPLLRQQRDLLIVAAKHSEGTPDGDLFEGLVNLADEIIDEYLQAYPAEAED